MSSSDDDDEQVLMHARVTRRKLGVSRQPPLAQAKADVQTAAKYVRNDAQRNRGSFCIGAFTVFLVVMFITLLQAAIARSTVVFKKLAEDQVGEFDLVVAPASDALSFVASADVQWRNGSERAAAPAAARGAVSNGVLLNFTEIERRTASLAALRGASPRWLGLSRVVRADRAVNSTAILLVIDTARERELGIGHLWPHPPLGAAEAHVSSVVLRRLGVEANAGQTVEIVVDLLGLASQTLGFDADSALSLLQSLSAQQGAAVSTNAAQFERLANFSLANVVDQINNATGQRFTVEALARYLFLAFGVPYPENFDFREPLIDVAFSALRSALTLRHNVTVVDGIDDAAGKYPKALGNVVILERSHVHDLVAEPLENLARSLRSLETSPLRFAGELALNVSDASVREVFDIAVDALQRAEDFEIDHYALSVIGMYEQRDTAYIGTGDEIDAEMILFTNDVMDAIGFGAPVSLSTPLAAAMRTLYFVRLFLDQIFTFASAVLIGLGSMLIYSLLLSNVEEKTFEYGMLRAQGMRQHVLIELLLIQSVAFSVPGILFGLLVAWGIYVPLGALVEALVDVPMEWRMEGSAIGIGIGIGIFMPLVANYGPISRALSRTLRDSLDKYHSTENEITVTIVALSEVGLAPWQVMLSVLMIAMGFIVYYLMPFSFIFQNIPLFLFLLTIILLGMLVGLSLVAQILQPLFERGVSWLAMWGGERHRLRPLVLKALHAHGRRNRKTAVMFTTALAFIIFAGTSFSLQANSIADNIELGVGGDIAVLALNRRFPVPRTEMAAYLDDELERSRRGETGAYVLGYTFETFPLGDYEFVTDTKISNLAGYPSLDCRIVGMDRAYVNETFAKFYNPTEVASGARDAVRETRTDKPDVVDLLYTNAGELRLPIEEADSGVEIPPPDVASERVDEMAARGGDDSEPFLGSRTGGYEISWPNERAYTEYVDVAVSEAVRLEGAIDTATPLLLAVSYRLTLTNSSSTVWLAKAQGMIGKMAGDLTYSSYRQLARNSKVAVSLPQYERMLRQLRNASAVAVPLGAPLPTGAAADAQAAAGEGGGGRGSEAQMSRLFVRVHESASPRDREAIINSLRNFIRDDITQVLDTAELVDSTGTAIAALQYFFIVVTVIAIVLCFFVLWLSFTANIRENAWEFGVLRAVGLTAAQVMRIYVYEAFSLITASLLLGTMIGVTLAVTLTLQFLLFTELPFRMDFPYQLFIIVVVMSFVVALAGSFYPARKISKKRIASVLKGL